ncbi:SusC/RagA family TonB-linked outer membrane protein [Flavobacterium lipolyticum]|uniref:TonB-dependent receptor n=1 Tax=Flavobacterium lipolyticum TaxID=2893754 RepID=A0ABS8M5V5_9FLAO|nr:TonB-dependent receptor [Flavobacterium sp. F-126]MCC9019551.1 TonB-dependent receptor [Flavobacterium sp. F-126]
MKLKFKWIFTVLIALSVQLSFSQEKTISGVVSGDLGIIPGVNIIVKGTKNSAQTDFDGKYVVKAKTGDVLLFSFVGMKDKSVTVGSSRTINISLESAAEMMNEVIVVGYGVQKRKEVTGSISKIAGNEVANLVVPSFEGALAGRAAGVQVVTNTGIIGAVPVIRIRGVASISSGSSPLIVLDGMPIVSGDIGSTLVTNGLGDINPADIESFEILKDGAATAIYGSRAANGVILITTKSGKKGTLKVNLTSTMGVASAASRYDLLETPDFIKISNEKTSNAGLTPWAVGDEYNTDWQGAIFRNAAQMNHSLSFSGGSDKTKYFLSLGLTEQEGINIANEMKRYSIRANIDQDINRWLSIGTNLSVTRTEYDGLNVAAGNLSGNVFNVIRQLPNTPIYDSANPTGYNLSPDNVNVGQWKNSNPVGDNVTNIVYVLDHNKYRSKVKRTLANLYANAKITSDLSFRLQVSADDASESGFRYFNPVHGDGRSLNGSLNNTSLEYFTWNWQNVLNYKKTFAENHNIGITGVAEYQKQTYNYYRAFGSDLISDFYDKGIISDSYVTRDSGGSMFENGIMSYLARGTYNYKEKYFIQGSIRRDGISKLGKDTRWNNFPGISGGWTISKENFMAPISNTISELKIRASYSEVGNTDIGNYPYRGLTVSSPYGTLNGIGYYQFGNDQLQWEASKKNDIGVDLGLFNNRINLTFDYYENNIDKLILEVPVARSLGIPGGEINQNIGKLINKGYEFSVSFKAFNTKNFSWDLSSNLTLAENIVQSVFNGQDIIGGTSTNTNIAPNIIIREGESINSLFGFEYWGVNKANGNPVYYKADGSLVQGKLPGLTYATFDENNPADVSKSAALTNSDRRILGNTLPTYFGSFSSAMRYKNLDFGFMFRFSGGNKVFNSTRRELLNQNFNNNSTEILGRWQSVENPGDGWTPRLYAGSNTSTNFSGSATSRFVENADFISLDNLTIGYTLPKLFLDKIKVENFRVFAQAQNVWLISKYKGINPEMETSGVDINGTPRTKVISVGINVSL